MSPRTRSLWVSMHRWSGIILGLLVVLIGVTGSLLVYEDELDTLLNPDLFRVEPGDVYLPYDAIVAAAAAVGPDHLQPGYLTRLDDSPSRPVVVTVANAALSPSSRLPTRAVVCASAVAGRASAPKSTTSAAAARKSERRATRWRTKPAGRPAGAIFMEGRPARQGGRQSGADGKRRRSPGRGVLVASDHGARRSYDINNVNNVRQPHKYQAHRQASQAPCQHNREHATRHRWRAAYYSVNNKYNNNLKKNNILLSTTIELCLLDRPGRVRDRSRCRRPASSRGENAPAPTVLRRRR